MLSVSESTSQTNSILDDSPCGFESIFNVIESPTRATVHAKILKHLDSTIHDKTVSYRLDCKKQYRRAHPRHSKADISNNETVSLRLIIQGYIVRVLTFRLRIPHDEPCSGEAIQWWFLEDIQI